MIKLALVDDHKIFLDSLSKHLSANPRLEVVLTADSCENLLENLDEKGDHGIDILLLDLKLKGMSGMDCLDRLHDDFPQIKTIVLSMFDQTPFIHEALKKGALSFVTKDSEPEILVSAIMNVHENGFYAHEALSELMSNKLAMNQSGELIFSAKDSLTEIQLEILRHLCQGNTSDEIGAMLFRSKRTIEGHRQRMIEKLDLKNTAALVAWAFREGLVS